MTVPVIQIGPATLFNGDALKILPSLEPADLLVVDPPYKLTTGGGSPSTPGARRMQGCFKESEYANDGNIVECNIDWTDFMPHLFRAVKDPGHAESLVHEKLRIHRVLFKGKSVFCQRLLREAADPLSTGRCQRPPDRKAGGAHAAIYRAK